MADKPKRAPRKKAAETVPIFADEIEHVAPLPVKQKKSSRKPPVVAAVTPDGIVGSLSGGEQRPLITHLPIRSSEIDNELFATVEPEVGASAESKSEVPDPFDPADTFVPFKAVVEESDKGVTGQAQIQVRPSLPLYYSEKLMMRYQDANREQRLPESCDIACFWDCSTFRGQPCAIPVAIEEGIWRVYGNFCSPECAAAFLFNERIDAHVQWERYALLNRLYATTEAPVRLAPARASLRLFGGILDAADFRGIVGDKRLRVDVMTPPMISIIQVMDTKPIDFYDASMKNTFIPWEMDRMNRPGAQGLRLRRTKPVVDKETTLEFCMGILA
jgi:hypothetical protein